MRNLVIFSVICLINVVSVSSIAASPEIYGDADLTIRYQNKPNQVNTGTSGLLRYSYHVGVRDTWDWVRYKVELGSRFRHSDPHLGLGTSAPSVALSRLQLTLEMLKNWYWDLGLINNPLAYRDFEFFWDHDYAFVGLGQRLELSNFRFNFLFEIEDNSGTLPADYIQEGTTGSAARLFGGNIGYIWQLSTSTTLDSYAEVFNDQRITLAGVNLRLALHKNKPIIVNLGGYLPVEKITTSGKTLASMIRLQYGELNVPKDWLVAVSGAFVGDDSYINTNNKAGTDSISDYANDRLARSAAFLLTGANTNSSLITAGLDFWYSFSKHFYLGVESDFGTSNSTGLSGTTFLRGELLARVMF